MRFVKGLSQETISLLWRIYRQSKFYRVRQRAHCILLSNQGHTTTELMKIFNVNLITIYNWFNAWELRRLLGLYDGKGKGRKGKLSYEQRVKVKEWAKAFPKNLSKVCALVQEEFDISVSKKTISRILKALNLTWRRVRRKTKGEPDPKEYQQKKEEIEELKQQEAQGKIDLRYFDESGFCLTPYVPYAWQEKGEIIEIESSNSKRLNVLGFLNKNNDLQAYTFEDSVNSDVVIACIDDFCRNLKKRTVLVVDNASIHASEAFEAKLTEWKEKGLEIFYLPTYSPELNLIEILWRFMKYEWIKFEAYKSWHHMVEYVETVINNFGVNYRINFV